MNKSNIQLLKNYVLILLCLYAVILAVDKEVKLEYSNRYELICKNCYSYYQIINEKQQATPNNYYTEEGVNDNQHPVVVSTTV